MAAASPRDASNAVCLDAPTYAATMALPAVKDALSGLARSNDRSSTASRSANDGTVGGNFEPVSIKAQMDLRVWYPVLQRIFNEVGGTAVKQPNVVQQGNK